MAVFRCEGKGYCPEWYEIEMADGAKMANVARRQRIASPKIMAVLAPSIYAEVDRASMPTTLPKPTGRASSNRATSPDPPEPTASTPRSQ